jgi:hypothetical protein
MAVSSRIKFKRIFEMRLSIPIVSLIGVMVATEVICDPEVLASKLCRWFSQTVGRLETGQTFRQNRYVIYIGIEHTDSMILSTMSDSSGKPVTRIPSPIVSKTPDSTLIGLLESIKHELVNWGDNSTKHVEYLLEAMNQLLRGNLQSAKSEINKSKKILDCDLTPNDKFQFNVLKVNNDEGTSEQPPGRRINLAIWSTDYLAAPGKAAAFRNWLGSQLRQFGNRGGDQSWYNKFLECIVEIAQALVNTLPGRYLPETESKFIGRYPLEDAGVIGNRMSQIEEKINPMDGRGKLVKEIAVIKSVLKQIQFILWMDLNAAQVESSNSISELWVKVTAPEINVYNEYMEDLYELRVASLAPDDNQRLD